MEEVPVTLVSLGDGAAVEKFDIELERVLKNIADPNTDPTAVRKITLTVSIKPNQERTIGTVNINATSKLSSGKGHETVVYVVKRGGQVSAVESNPAQMSIPGDVVPIGERRP